MVLRTLLVWVGALVLGGCTVFFSTDVSEVEGPAIDEVNACGGDETLRWEGEALAPGDRCGACGDGFLTCNGVDALRCVAATPPNPCGGCGNLAFEPYDACGVCGDGFYVCNGLNGLICEAASAPNACGGCGPLAGAPGYPCDANTLANWACVSPTDVACTPGDVNPCGGSDALTFEGDEAFPGESCAGACRDGVLQCAGPESLVCAGAVAENACGGCSVPPGEIGESCGPCGGVWACGEDGSYVCDAVAPNACGGCEPLSLQPGQACGTNGVAVCNSTDTVACDGGGGDSNACGGLERLDATPGGVCGACDSGTWVCTSTASVDCVGAGSVNPCFGCEPLDGDPGAPCGPCGSGTWTCDGEEAVACIGAAAAADEEENTCGGCGTLPGTIGAPCGICHTYACFGDARLQCVFDPDDECLGGVTCEDLNCDRVFRTCVEDVAESGATAAYCGACFDGYVEVEGECVPDQVCEGDMDCPEPSVTEWSECRYPEPCGERGARQRQVLRFECLGGVCRPRLDDTEVEECARRDTDGRVVSGLDGVPPAASGPCANEGVNPCSEAGVQQVEQYVCRDSEVVLEQATLECRLPSTDGVPCGDGGECRDQRCIEDTPDGTIGAPCDADSSCDSRNCSLNLCAPLGYVTIPAGGGTVGANALDGEGLEDARPQIVVRFNAPFFMRATEVTAQDFGREDPSCPECPVTSLDWQEVLIWLNERSQAEGLQPCYIIDAEEQRVIVEGTSCDGYRLPNEFEWEYAARAGAATSYFCGPLANCLRDHAWVAQARFAEVGTRTANPFGLYDIEGNAAEWTESGYTEAGYAELDSPLEDPDADDYSGGLLVVRGCSIADESTNDCRHAIRRASSPLTAPRAVGFRPVRSLP